MATQMWTAAKLCQSEKPKKSETSILGRLFTEKPVTQDTSFRLVLNEGVSEELRPLRIERTDSRDEAEETLAEKLEGLPLEGTTVEWCVSRLDIEECPTTAADLEARIHRRLGVTLARMDHRLMPHELDIVFAELMRRIEELARAHEPEGITKAEFTEAVQRTTDDATSRGLSAEGREETLRGKLVAAGITGADADAVVALRQRFSKDRRSAVGRHARELDRLSDDVFVACNTVRLKASDSGEPSGRALYTASVQAAQDVIKTGWSRDVRPAAAVGALHEITARCQHRYDD